MIDGRVFRKILSVSGHTSEHLFHLLQPKSYDVLAGPSVDMGSVSYGLSGVLYNSFVVVKSPTGVKEPVVTSLVSYIQR